VIPTCVKCGKLWQSDDLVEVLIYARINPLRSTISTALSKPVDWEPKTLAHVFCDDPKGEREGIEECGSI
jgi:hypothetical protein